MLWLSIVSKSVSIVNPFIQLQVARRNGTSLAFATPSKPVTPIKHTRLEQWEENDDVIEGEKTPGEVRDGTF